MPLLRERKHDKNIKGNIIVWGIYDLWILLVPCSFEGNFYLRFQINFTARFAEEFFFCYITIKFYRRKLAVLAFSWRYLHLNVEKIILNSDHNRELLHTWNDISIENLHSMNHKLHHSSKSSWLWSQKCRKFSSKSSIIASNFLKVNRCESNWTDIWWDKIIQFSSS